MVFSEAHNPMEQITRFNTRNRFGTTQAQMYAPNHTALPELSPNAHHAEDLIRRADCCALEGNLKEARIAYRKALQLCPDACEVHFKLANILYQSGRYKEAIRSYRNVLEIRAGLPEALNNMGLAYHSLGNRKKAIECFTKAMKIRPGYADACSNRANVLYDAGLVEEAIAEYRHAIELDPRHFDALYNLGNAWYGKKDLKQAALCYHQALALKPDYVDAWINLARTCHELGEYYRALSACSMAAGLDPEIPDIYFHMADILVSQDRTIEAIKCYMKAIALKPDFSDAYINLGNAFHRQDQFEKAVSCYLKALRTTPGDPRAYNNLGKSFKEQLDLDRAFACYRKAIQLKPDYADAHTNYAVALLLSGRLEEGWREYEWRLKNTNVPEHAEHIPDWDGSPLEGKTLYVYAEQGIGDEIMFASCLPDVLNRAEICYVECDSRLMPVFERSFPNIRLLPRKNPGDPPVCDYQGADMKIPLGSLPLHFRSNIRDFPHRPSYLLPDTKKRRQWRKRFQSIGAGRYVGISWRAGKGSETGPMRSIALRNWRALFSLPGIYFINLQYGNCEKEIRDIQKCTGIIVHDWEDADPLKDMDGFAAKISALDLVISVDNSTAHLAGALGVPVWLLLPFTPDWRWGLNSETSPWYPAMHIIRQKLRGDWGHVLERVAEKIREYRCGET